MTSTELEIHQPTSAPVVMAQGAASIAATARALVDAHQIGTALCRTSFVPKHFQGKPDDAAAAILYGSTIDMDPVTALQNIYVISGKPALYARTMVAIVLSKGHDIWTEDESDGAVTVAGKRRGSENVERVTWTADMAARAGYTSNANYKTNQRAMLYARASGDVARRIAPDALLGMAHNVEELTISEPSAPRQFAASAPAADRMAAALGTVTAEQITDVSDAELLDDETPEPMTARTRGELFALFGQKGVLEADQLPGVNHINGTAHESRADITEAEAKAAIKVLRTRPDAEVSS